jgi:hypothetical protein
MESEKQRGPASRGAGAFDARRPALDGSLGASRRRRLPGHPAARPVVLRGPRARPRPGQGTPGNEASQRTLERAGFVREGLLRSYEEIKGERWDLGAWVSMRFPTDCRLFRGSDQKGKSLGGA